MTSTIESNINIDRPVTESRVHGTTMTLLVGKTAIVVQTDLCDDDGKRVALLTPGPGGHRADGVAG